MASCIMTCRQCKQEKSLVEFISSNSRLVYRCKNCISINERIEKFQKVNCVELSCCQNESCPSKEIGSDVRLLRFRDDGKVACLGCCRFKNRRGKKQLHRLAMKEHFDGMSCLLCGCLFKSDKFCIDFFEMLNASMDIITYSKFTNVSTKNIEIFLKSFVKYIVCVKCARVKLTSHLR